MKFKRFRWALPAIMLLIAVLLLFKGSRPETHILPDGTTISLIAVGYEKTNTIIYGSSWRKFLHRVLPTSARSMARVSTMPVQLPDTNTPAFIARLYNKNGIHQEVSKAQIFDEYGMEYDANYGGGEQTYPDGNTTEYRSWYRGIYGPHRKIAGIRLYGDSKQPFTIDLHDPAVPIKQRPDLHSLQQNKKDKWLSVTLTSFSSGWKDRESSLWGGKGPSEFSQATFKVVTNGGPAATWYVDKFYVSTNGGAFLTGPRSTGKIGEEIAVNFYGLVSRTNPCRIRLGLARHDGFTADELFTFKNVPFPADDEVITTNLSVQMQGLTLTLEQMTGVARSIHPNQASVKVQLSPPQWNMNVQIHEATDEQGKPVPDADYSPQVRGAYSFRFQPGARARKMNLTFVVHKTHFFDFEAKPTFISEAANDAH